MSSTQGKSNPAVPATPLPVPEVPFPPTSGPSWGVAPFPAAGPPANTAPSPVYVRDVMSRDVVVVGPEDKLRRAVEVLSQYGFSGVAVVERPNKPVGVLSEKDVLRTLREQGGLNFPKTLWDLLLAPSSTDSKEKEKVLLHVLDNTRVRQAMSMPPVTIEPEATLVDAIRTMVGHGINRLLVVENGRLVGIVTRHDLLASLHPQP